MTDVRDTRAAYAAELRQTANLKSESLVTALASVPREHFLGPGPWHVFGLDQPGPQLTEDADPARVYQNVAVAIDRERNLYNGPPSQIAPWLDALDIARGERVLHIGCGTGYYTALIAEMVGASGQVWAIDVDPSLADRARTNVAPWPWVEVRHGDGRSQLPTDVDVVLVHAGSTHVLPEWLDSTRDGARLLVPLTVSFGGISQSLSKGMVLHATRAGQEWSARVSGFVMIYSLVGVRDESRNQELGQALRAGAGNINVTRIRRDRHDAGPDCWLHGECCLSR